MASVYEENASGLPDNVLCGGQGGLRRFDRGACHAPWVGRTHTAVRLPPCGPSAQAKLDFIVPHLLLFYCGKIK